MTEESGEYVADEHNYPLDAGHTKPSEFGENINFYNDWVHSDNFRTGLNVQCVISRQSKPTLNIEVAPITKKGESPQWGQKITLQLTAKELVEFSALLLGLQTVCGGKYHGAARNKGFTVHDNTDKGLIITLSEAGRTICHSLGRPERAQLAVFVVRQLAQAWKVGVTDVWGMMPKIYR